MLEAYVKRSIKFFLQIYISEHNYLKVTAINTELLAYD